MDLGNGAGSDRRVIRGESVSWVGGTPRADASGGRRADATRGRREEASGWERSAAEGFELFAVGGGFGASPEVLRQEGFDGGVEAEPVEGIAQGGTLVREEEVLDRAALAPDGCDEAIHGGDRRLGIVTGQGDEEGRLDGGGAGGRGLGAEQGGVGVGLADAPVEDGLEAGGVGGDAGEHREEVGGAGEIDAGGVFGRVEGERGGGGVAAEAEPNATPTRAGSV